MSVLQTEPDIAVSVPRCARIWKGQGYRVGSALEHGPSGFKFVLVHNSSPQHFGSVIVSQSELAGVEWIHASIAWTERMPTYNELTILHRSVFGLRRHSYQAFVPADQHVNIHRFALHIWGRADGQAVLPNFGQLGSI